MNPLTEEWIAKAEGDYLTARRELGAAQSPNYDAACFHAQQCVEKYLKARLVEAGVGFPKIHDLGTLLDLVVPTEPAWEAMRADVDSLTDLAVEVRYPGHSSDADEAEEAVRIATGVRDVARKALGLPD